MSLQLSNEQVIFSSVFSNDENVFLRRQQLLVSLNNADIFKNEFYIFYVLTREFPRVNISKDFIELFLRTNRAEFSKNPNIDIAKYRVTDTDPFVEFANSCIATFEECVKTKVEEDEFYRSVEMHKMEHINEESIAILEESAVILTEGVMKRGKSIAGYEGMRGNLKNRFLKLDNLMEKADRKGLIVLGANDDEEAEEDDGTIKLVTTYGIKELDKHIHGIYEGDMVSILAPAKGCKTRFSNSILHNAVVNHGVNIVVWPIENGYRGWQALIRARHFNYLYNELQTDVKNRKFINDDMIRKGALEGEMRELERASWTDLKHNINYGKITIIDEDFDVDTFIEVLDNAVTSTASTLICVDYLQLISGGNGRNQASKQERIGDAYKKILQFIKKRKIAGVFPGQLKQTAVGDLNRSNPEELITKDLRDAAGESYEVIKTPDVNLALYGTPEDIKRGEMKILSIPSRNHAPFEPIDLYCDAGSCTFASVTKEKRFG